MAAEISPTVSRTFTPLVDFGELNSSLLCTPRSVCGSERFQSERYKFSIGINGVSAPTMKNVSVDAKSLHWRKLLQNEPLYVCPPPGHCAVGCRRCIGTNNTA